MPSVTVRKARKRHRCDDNVTLNGRRHFIEPGHVYRRKAYFPTDDVHGGRYKLGTSPQPIVYRSCVPCVTKRGDSLGACETFCCGTTPCARPLNHNGDHSCCSCPEQGPPLVPVTRPNGKVYQPYLPPRAMEIDWNDGDETRIVVFGTHDVDRAFQLAQKLWGTDVDRESAELEWFRRTMRDGNPWLEYDSVRGAAVVVFKVW